MDLLVTTDWLASELGADDLVLLDCSVFLVLSDNGFVSESGRANFEEHHIAGARFADLTGDLVDTDSPNGFAMPTPAAFGTAMERLGVSDASRVVVYDADGSSMWAARVWFMLRWIGFDNAAILDGGLKAWQAEGRATESGPGQSAAVPAGSLSLTPRPGMDADKDEVMAMMADGGSCLIDALPPAIFRGEIKVYGDGGHIPGAINIPASGMVDSETGRFLPLEEIRPMFPDQPEARMVAY